MKSYEKTVQGVHDGVQGVRSVQEWLEQVRFLDELIKSKSAERDQLMQLATSITPQMTGMPHGGGVSDKGGNVAARLAELAKETDRLVDMYVDQRTAALGVIRRLPEKYYAVLHRYYIRHMSWEDVGCDLNIATMTVYRRRDKAFRLLEGVIECYAVPVV